MFLIALLVGAYSYSIFFLGLLGLLSKQVIAIDSTIFLLLSIYFVRDTKLLQNFKGFFKWLQNRDRFERIIVLLILAQAIVNFIGVLAPELSFDALWYHLVFPKIYLMEGVIRHISGGLLFYSDMPKLAQMLYIPALVFGNETLAKFTQFSFGLGVVYVIYRFSRIYVPETLSLLAVLIFYSNPVVSWQSTVAYIDLARTFFEILALYYLLIFLRSKKEKFLIYSAFVLGLAITTKVLAIGSLLIFSVLIFIVSKSILKIVKFILISLTIPLPWFIFSYLNTGNAVYPFFTKVYPTSASLNPTNLINFVFSSDPISPVYLIILPLVLLGFSKFEFKAKILSIYCIIAFLILFIGPQSGGGRFIMAYLPAFSVLAAIVLSKIDKNVKSYISMLVIGVALICLSYRMAASLKYIPVVLGFESRGEFLASHLNYSFGDFYDIDGYFKNHIKPNDKVLIYGIHNLYYVDFPFIDSSWYKKGDYYNYILERGGVPNKKDLKLVYQNQRTDVKLYKVSSQ